MLQASTLADHFHWETLVAAGIGLIAGCAFLGALLLGFLGGAAMNRVRPNFQKLVLQGNGMPAVTRVSTIRVIIFVLIGAALAVVFQLPYGTELAYIQAFIVGVGWPTLVGQAMSQASSQQILNLADKVEDPSAA